MSYLTVLNHFVKRLERRHLRWVGSALRKRIMGQLEAVDVSESSDPWWGSCYSNFIIRIFSLSWPLSPSLAFGFLVHWSACSQHFLKCLWLYFKGGILILKMIILHHVKWPGCNKIFLQGTNVLLGVSLQARVIRQLLHCTGCIFLQHLVEHFRTVGLSEPDVKSISLTQVCN